MMADPSTAEQVARCIDDEFARFKFVDQAQDIDSVLSNPLILITNVDEKRRVPAALIHAVKDNDLMKMKVRMFFGLRYLTHQLTLYNNQIN